MEGKGPRFVGCWVSTSLFRAIEDYMKKNSFGSKSELLRSLLRETVMGDKGFNQKVCAVQ